MSGIFGKATNRQVHKRQLISSSESHSVSRQATTVMESSVLHISHLRHPGMTFKIGFLSLSLLAADYLALLQGQAETANIHSGT